MTRASKLLAMAPASNTVSDDLVMKGPGLSVVVVVVLLLLLAVFSVCLVCVNLRINLAPAATTVEYVDAAAAAAAAASALVRSSCANLVCSATACKRFVS